ncbi:DUF3889 domain-containing protein [Niallia sp. 01092]|uniref:DUF3889 domain-containing protein n=1 Tax=unclassified Niallia TaxID=2837522 RepID=UPI003FD54924
MKKSKILSVLLVSIFVLSGVLPASANNGLPSYVKWGKLAMTKTKEKYPNSEIIDYLHIGKEQKNNTSIEKFKLIVKKENKEIGVLVDLTFDTRTERLLSVNMTEIKP